MRFYQTLFGKNQFLLQNINRCSKEEVLKVWCWAHIKHLINLRCAATADYDDSHKRNNN